MRGGARKDSGATPRSMAAVIRPPALIPLTAVIALLQAQDGREEQGHGVAKDAVAAARLYRQAAQKGLRSAQSRLGLALMQGFGGEKDPQEGESWLRRAAVPDRT